MELQGVQRQVACGRLLPVSLNSGRDGGEGRKMETERKCWYSSNEQGDREAETEGRKEAEQEKD